MSSPVLGIDLGTTNSVVAAVTGGEVRVLADGEGNQLFPSVVSFHPSGDVLTGHAARERRLLDASNTIYSVKRLIGRPFRSEEVRRAIERFPFGFEEGPTGGALVVARGETYTMPEISAFVLREVRALAEDALDQVCRSAVITVPANFNELQRSATKAAGRVAGLDVLRILNEPTAAALAYGCGKQVERERIAVYDLGGGTFDITLLELAGDVYEVLSTSGDTFLGGDDIDVMIADEMAATFLQQHRYDVAGDVQAYERLRAAAEWAKCQLSSAPDVELAVEELAFGEGGDALDLNFAMQRSRLETLTQPLIARTFDVCEEAMRLAQIRPTQLDTVILVGGGTRIPMVRRLVEEYFGRAPLGTIDPDLVVAQGAAIQASALSSEVAGDASAAGPIGSGALKRRTFSADPVPSGPAFQQANKAPPPPPGAGRGGAYAGPGLPPRPGGAAPPAPAPPKELPVLSFDELDAESLDEPSSAFNLDDLDLAGGSAPIDLVRLELSASDVSQPQSSSPPGQGFDPLNADLPVLDLPPLDNGGPTGADPGMELGAPSLSAESMALPEGGAPLLLDVTPHSLCIETVRGYCEVIIPQNAAIPVEQARVFSTSQDFQQEVRVRVCQGQSRRLEENEILGEVELSGLSAVARGKLQIEVVFVIDPDGTLRVRAVDKETGAQQNIHVRLVGGVDEEEVERMRERQARMMEAN